MAKNDQKWPKMTQNGQTLANIQCRTPKHWQTFNVRPSNIGKHSMPDPQTLANIQLNRIRLTLIKNRQKCPKMTKNGQK